MSLANMKYYDHPEGQDAFGKMIATNKYALTTGLIWSSYDVLMVTKPQGYLATIGRYAYWTGPFIGMASAFTMTTLAATKIRGKCDTLVYFYNIVLFQYAYFCINLISRWNYVAGAIASASVYGAWKRSVVAGGVMAVAFSQ